MILFQRVTIPEGGEQLPSPDEAVVVVAEMRRYDLLHNHSKPLDMGASFDEASKVSATRFFEEKLETKEPLTAKELKAARNRRGRYHTVVKTAPLSNYPDEFWHDDGGNQFDGVRTGREATHGKAPFTDENAAWEDARVDDHVKEIFYMQLPYSQIIGKPPSERARWLEAQFLRVNRTTHPKASRLNASEYHL